MYCIALTTNNNKAQVKKRPKKNNGNDLNCAIYFIDNECSLHVTGFTAQIMIKI